MTLGFGNINHFVDIRRRFLSERRQIGVGSLKSTYLQFSRCYTFASCRNTVGINCTLRWRTVLDFCRHQQGWPWMTLNARFNLKCALQTYAWRMYVVSFGASMRGGMNTGLHCQRQKCGQWTVISEHMRFYEFSQGFTLLQRGRRAGVEPLNLVIIHIMQHNATCIWYLEMCGCL